jgi:hypothetical protein
LCFAIKNNISVVFFLIEKVGNLTYRQPLKNIVTFHLEMAQQSCCNLSMTTATDMLNKYIAAEAAILDGQSVRFGDRILTRANLIEVQNGRKDWERRVSAETRISAGGTSPRYQTPDFSR